MTLDGPSWWYQEQFPLDVFPHAVERMVADTANSLCVHPDMLATALLPIAGALIGNSRRVLTHQPPWTEPARIWAAIIADPGGKKSPALSRLMAPLHRIEERLEGYHRHQIEEWKHLPKQDRPPIPKPIRLIVSDITTATIRDRLSTHPRGILGFRDELTGWLESIGRANYGGGGDRQQWLELWPESAVLRVDRKTDSESTVIRRAFVGMLGGIQPDKLRNIAGRDGDDGMLDRFLLCAAPFIEEEWGTPPVDPLVLKAYDGLVDALYGLTEGTEPKLVKLDVGGNALVEGFFRNHYAQKNNLRRTNHPLAGMWGKCDAYLYRIALLLTELWHVCEDTPEVVDEQRILGAERVVDYYKNQRHQLQNILAPSEYEKAGPAHEAKVIDWLGRHDGKATMTQLCRGPLQRVPAKEARAILDNLVEKSAVQMTRVERATLVVLNRGI